MSRIVLHVGTHKTATTEKDPLAAPFTGAPLALPEGLVHGQPTVPYLLPGQWPSQLHAG